MAFIPEYNLIEELKWRGLFHQDVPGTEEFTHEGNGEWIRGL